MKKKNKKEREKERKSNLQKQIFFFKWLPGAWEWGQ